MDYSVPTRVHVESPLVSQVSRTLEADTSEKFLQLIQWFKGHNRAIVALSGGVDSSVVAAVANLCLGANALGVSAKTATTPVEEIEAATDIAKKIGIVHRIIAYDDLANTKIVQNQPDRCYHCRRELSSELRKIAVKESFDLILDGTNADDLNTHRPGAVALREAGVRSPLAEVGLRKSDIRSIAKGLGLPNAERPSNACLASRFPYGQLITKIGVSRVAQAEKFIREISGIGQLRVRDHDGIARLEIEKNERKYLFDENLMDIIGEKLHSLGYKYVTLDLIGYRTGSLNEQLEKQIIPIHLKGFSESENQP
uniref:PP-loop domain-containing protein n=1 Tax=uncultured marine thaumarchaeote KM3_72_A09 TaxID=1456261 RepID=A0A075HHV0_9ARCH|nr:PP-loop domain-containing protein [uncultured marine thaumarchaeote KM3_72_A09]